MAKASAPFRFRSFQLVQRGDAWKAGTDSILLGCWCNTEGVNEALDMGTGSGILALMLAQKNPELRIDAVDISEKALAEATENVEQSPWSSRIDLIHGDIMADGPWRRRNYELIITNPPYYPGGRTPVKEERIPARRGIGFSYETIPKLAAALLSELGALNIVLPARSGYHFIEIANTEGLYVTRRLDVRHRDASPDALTLLELRRELRVPVRERLVLRTGAQESPEYRSLCTQFRL